MNGHAVVSREEWVAARQRLLDQEKEFTRMRDRLGAERRALPWVKVEKAYAFDGPRGKETLADLFGGRSQLIVQHFMFGPGWEEGCVGCSFQADHVGGALLHLGHHDVSFAAVSRAPYAKIEAFRRRMGWRFPWVSSFGSDFNLDYNVSASEEDRARGKMYYNYAERDFQIDELSGLSVFHKDDSGDVFHTYSTFARGAEEALGAYVYLDLTPKGRNETGPGRNLTDWVRHHDKYGAGGHVDATGRYVAAGEQGCCHAKEGQS
jgi:predicted dithiol-disulfide oxidoreductase (DUF899 family)